MRRRAARTSFAALAVFSLVLTACGTSADSKTSSASGAINVVASTNVYGDIAKTIGGEHVTVEAIISKTSQDPHSYEATAQDRLKLSHAKLVIENGGGYDSFMDGLTQASKVDPANVISAVDVSGLDSSSTQGSTNAVHGHTDFNEHVWYSLETMGKVADTVAAHLSKLDATNAAQFGSNAKTFKSSLTKLGTRLETIKSEHPGTAVAITEPVPLYLVEQAGMENKTPEAFSHAIEEGTDVPATVLRSTLELFSSHQVKLLAYNEQTEGSQTQALKQAAEDSGIPVLNFTETMPESSNYLQWMTANVSSLESAFQQAKS
ncbi:metal ABC transporter solute-binding protein, Zn/Mn family [Pseudarthrobacter sp. J1738]|uniref:metal ABC transporter solute-binding protein, Zn/Mn family n=1 Tax=unclassified Pseudarthrobacter TaxID=2647000 RepID=UPI003D28A6DB